MQLLDAACAWFLSPTPSGRLSTDPREPKSTTTVSKAAAGGQSMEQCAGGLRDETLYYFYLYLQAALSKGKPAARLLYCCNCCWVRVSASISPLVATLWLWLRAKQHVLGSIKLTSTSCEHMPDEFDELCRSSTFKGCDSMTSLATCAPLKPPQSK